MVNPSWLEGQVTISDCRFMAQLKPMVNRQRGNPFVAMFNGYVYRWEPRAWHAKQLRQLGLPTLIAWIAKTHCRATGSWIRTVGPVIAGTNS